ncbi:DM DNA binding domain protein [Ancylostoma ceylanicum]|uniref:DM DNA binding domain protein n=1 Tax=Ancylostoma ceylanicum TaxID=53326 RepID=A0A0D6M213_9BILA|nr:DM DNA binding domain protein [Ancylostoma ceylanicum]
MHRARRFKALEMLQKRAVGVTLRRSLLRAIAPAGLPPSVQSRVQESEIDVVALSPAPSQNSYNSNQSEKKYFCQRCLNHDLQFPRKGHKPVCNDCIMVEQRRQLNNMLSKSKLAESPRETVNGRRVRDPQCARCRQHGFRVPLRGHKRVLCQFATCKCEMIMGQLRVVDDCFLSEDQFKGEARWRIA